MKRYSQLVLKSFRKNDIGIISDFISKIKIKILRNVIFSLLVTKSKLLLKVGLSLIFNNSSIHNNFKNLFLEILNVSYFYSDLFYCSSYLNYNVITFDNNIKLFYNFIFDLVALNEVLRYVSSIRIKSFSHMPTKRKHITVLKSPHTDKKSREQFTLETYRKSISDEFNILHSIIESTMLFGYSNCQLIYKKLTKRY